MCLKRIQNKNSAFSKKNVQRIISIVLPASTSDFATGNTPNLVHFMAFFDNTKWNQKPGDDIKTFLNLYVNPTAGNAFFLLYYKRKKISKNHGVSTIIFHMFPKLLRIILMEVNCSVARSMLGTFEGCLKISLTAFIQHNHCQIL
uniref:Uncharacterized protein n=1 Tax=Micrurus lemniscatus lemniscatus TaxID=129467 RepID=A0A2D4H982_MICLE